MPQALIELPVQRTPQLGLVRGELALQRDQTI